MFFRLLLLLAALLLPATAHAAPAKDWAHVVTLTPEGVHVIGNPAARNRLVEYVSYTCPHCAHFVAEASAPLKTGWVAKGALAVEIRHLVRDRYDLTAALLARCGGPARFPGNHEAIFAAQTAWIDKIRAYEIAPPSLPANANRTAVMIDLADKTGLISLMARRGITPAQSRACLVDQKAMDAVLAMTKKGIEQDKVTGTPSFLLNGALTEAHDWASLRPVLPKPAN